MPINKIKSLLLICLAFVSLQARAQHIKLDKLEQLFDQGYFELVHRKAERLLNDPQFDYSLLPKYYKAITTLELAQQKKWQKKHPTELAWASSYLLELKTQQKGQKILQAHQLELSALYEDLAHHISTLDTPKEAQQKEEWHRFVADFFADFPLLPNETEGPQLSRQMVGSAEQKALISEAEKHLGVAYLSAGSDPNGFDCSGFTQYVFAKQGFNLPRRAADQYKTVVIIEANEAQAGDLVFFSNGGEVNHVGILINEKGAPTQMIHASSSKGISITDVANSTYWSTRVVGYGRMITEKK
ncbi:MAG: hypothetical protein RLZZ65_171 [Bacteroidota bacterium]